MPSSPTISSAADPVSAAGQPSLLTLQQLQELTGAKAHDSAAAADGYRLAEPAAADAGSVCVVWQRATLRQAIARGAGLLVIPAELAELAAGRPRLVVQDARLALARISAAAKPAARH